MQIRLIGATAAALGALSALAWQNSLATLQLTQETFERSITNYVQNQSGSGDSWLNTPGMGMAAQKVFLGMDDAGRAAAVKDLGFAARKFVMSPAFSASYDAYLKSSRNAINHGIAVTDPQKAMNDAMKSQSPEAMESSMNKMMKDMYKKQVMDRLPEIAKMTKESIGIMADLDAGMMDSTNPATAAEKANVAKGKAMLAEAKKQSATNLEQARATYKAAMMLVAGLASDAQAAAGVAEGKRQEQQRNYNQYALKPMLKKQLQAFVAIAKTVDFKAATQAGNGGKKVFVYKAYESKSGFWKMLYRLGPGGTNAAVAVALAWITEL